MFVESCLAPTKKRTFIRDCFSPFRSPKQARTPQRFSLGGPTHLLRGCGPKPLFNVQIMRTWPARLPVPKTKRSPRATPFHFAQKQQQHTKNNKNQRQGKLLIYFSHLLLLLLLGFKLLFSIYKYHLHN